MGNRGPKSGAHLEVVKPSPGAIERVVRPAAPVHLNDEQAAIWLEVVEDLAADHFSPSTYDVLAQYCCHVVTARHVSKMIEQAEREDDLDIVRLDKLYKMQARESSEIGKLATRMRITQQATTNHRGNKAGGKKLPRPWET